MEKCDYCKRKALLAKAKKDGLSFTVLTIRQKDGRGVIEIHVHPKGTNQAELVHGKKPFLKATLYEMDLCTCGEKR